MNCRKMPTGYFDKKGHELFDGDLLTGAHGGILRVCFTGDRFVLLDSIMFPFDMTYSKECERREV